MKNTISFDQKAIERTLEVMASKWQWLPIKTKEGTFMDTTTLKDLPPAIWHPFSLQNSAEIRKIAPHRPGIYIIRFQQSFGRFFGQTDIAYIGRAKSGTSSRKGLNRRMCEYFDLSPHRSTCHRVMTWIEKIGNFEIAFFPFFTDTEAVNKEALFLQQFEKEHAELPPFNRQG